MTHLRNHSIKNILVTGGAGFIGANFIRYLFKMLPDIKIVNLDLLTYAGSLDNLKNLSAYSYHFIHGDICDAALIKNILTTHQIDTIIHFAAESHVDRSIQGPAPFIQTNIIGTYTLLEAARQYWLNEKKWDESQCLFHHVSTDEVFGSLDLDSHPFKEISRFSPSSPYSASKASSDHLVSAYFHTYNLPITISNCSNNYGKYQHQEKLIPTIIRQCLQKKPIPIYGDGSNIRDWLYVDDHCEALLTIITQGEIGETYNVGGETQMSNLEIATHICSVFDDFNSCEYSHTQLIQFVEDRPGHDFRYAIDIGKINQKLKWYPKICFTDGILKTIHFYHQQTQIVNQEAVFA